MTPLRGLGLAIAGAIALAACVLSGPASAAAADFTWTGSTALAPGAASWSNASNWAGNSAPSGSVGRLTFPALASCNASADTCYSSQNDLTGINATALSIDDAVGYGITGNALTLSGSGGTTLSAATTASPSGSSSSVVFAPISLTGSQAWSVNGASGPAQGVGQLQLAGAVTDASTTDTLGINLSNQAYLLLSGDDEVGPVTITGADSSKSGLAASQNGFLDLSNKLNASDGNAVTLGHAALNDAGPASVGPLTSTGGVVELGDASPPANSGMLTVAGAATFDSASAMLASIQQAGSTAGTDYGQLAATGKVTLGGTLVVNVSSSCPTLSDGTVYTLVTGGSLSGTFSNAPTSGSTVSTQGFGCTSYTLQINYSATSVTATITSGGTTPGAPVNKTSPTISGNTFEGQALTESHGTWTNSPTGYTYQWQDCDVAGNNCSAIPGSAAQAQQYTLTSSDVCHTIRVQETASNTAGSGNPATSAATGVVQTASPPTDFTWTGASIPYSATWSTSTNWSGCWAPQGQVGTLTFHSSACSSCAMSQDIAGLAASNLDFGGSGPGTLNGPDTVTLDSGLSGSAQINAPIALGGDNTWTVSSVGLRGGLSGASHGLNVNFPSEGNLGFSGASNEVGPVTLNSPNVYWSQVELGTPGLEPGDLNGNDGNSVTLNGIMLYGDGGTVGPLTATNSLLKLDDTPEVLAVNGAMTLAPTDEIYFWLKPGNGSPMPGTDYSQVTTTGAAHLASTILWLSTACNQPPGTVYTLVDAQGGVTGEFENPNSPNGPPSPLSDGSILQAQSTCSGPPPKLVIHYTADTVTATVAGPPTVQTGSASAISETTALLGGSVTANGAGVSDCHFDYGTTTSYGQSIPCSETVGSGFSPVPVSAAVGGLSPGTTYHFRLVASNAIGTGTGADATFTTTTAPPAQPSGPTASGGGAPAPTCADHSATVGLYQAETECFKREGSRLVTDGRVRLNGLDISPDASTKLTVDLGTGHLSDGLATVYVGSIPVYFGPLDLDLRSTDDLVSVNLKAKLAGLPLAGSVKLTPTSPGNSTAAVSASVGVGGGDGLLQTFSISGSLDLHLSNDAGLEVDKAELAVTDVPLGPLTLQKAELSYERKPYGDVWTGEGELELPDPLPSLGVTVGLTDGHLSEIGVTVGDINKPIGEIVFLQKLGLDVKWVPNVAITGLIGLSAGPEFELDGHTFTIASLDSSLTANFTNPFMIEVKGDLHLLGDAISLASVDVQWTVPNRFAFTAHAGFNAGPASVSVDGEGLIASNGFGFKAQGQISVPAVTAQGLAYISEKGITGCAGIQAGPTGILGGFGYHWGDSFPDLWFDNCDGMLAYETAAAGGSARDAAATAHPVKIKVPPGQAQTLFGARGVADYPTFTLRSPSGQTIDSSRGVQGAVDRGGYRWVTDPVHHGTYVFVARPTPGTWTLTPSAASPAIGSVGSALSAPLTVVARATRRGRAEVLSWDAPSVPGQSLRFTEVGGDIGRAILTTGRASGRIRFRPTDTGRGERRYIQIEIARGGLPEAVIHGPNYSVPAPPRPKVPARVLIRRRSNSVTIAWRPVSRAKHYEVWVTTSDHRRLFFENGRDQDSVTVPDVIFPIRVTVLITTIALDGVQSRPEHITVTLGASRRHHKRR